MAASGSTGRSWSNQANGWESGTESLTDAFQQAPPPEGEGIIGFSESQLDQGTSGDNCYKTERSDRDNAFWSDNFLNIKRKLKLENKDKEKIIADMMDESGNKQVNIWNLEQNAEEIKHTIKKIETYLIKSRELDEEIEKAIKTNQKLDKKVKEATQKFYEETEEASDIIKKFMVIADKSKSVFFK